MWREWREVAVAGVEGLPGPARAAVARGVAARLGLGPDPAEPDIREDAHRWSALAAKAAALTTLEDEVVFCAWLHVLPVAPAHRQLHARLLAAALRGARVRVSRHVAVVLRQSPHEAFDALADRPEVSLHALCRLHGWLASPGADAGLPAGQGPAAAMRRLDVCVPPHSPDNPADLDRLAAFCAGGLRRELAKL
jgi:hypothetical protein